MYSIENAFHNRRRFIINKTPPYGDAQRWHDNLLMFYLAALDKVFIQRVHKLRRMPLTVLVCRLSCCLLSVLMLEWEREIALW